MTKSAPMGHLQEAFDAALSAAVDRRTILAACIRRVAKRREIDLSEEQVCYAQESLMSALDERQETFDLAIPAGDVSIAVSFDEICSALDGWQADFQRRVPEIIRDAIDDSSSRVLASLYETAPTALADRRRVLTGFERRLRKRWSEGLRRLRMLLLIAQESHQAVMDVFPQTRRRTKAGVAQFDALLRLHARACKIMSEIIALLETGHADGANARWRSLHETAVVALFLKKNAKAVSERYLAHSGIERHKAAIQYQRHVRALGYERIGKKHIAALEAEYHRLIQLYGKDFATEYGWASEAIQKGRPTFADIESRVRMQKWRPFYKMACHSVHSGAQGLQFSLGLRPGAGPRFLLGVSNAGLCDPGHCSAISLTLTTNTLLTTFPNIDHLVTAQVMLQLTDEIGEAFLIAHEQLEREDATGECHVEP